MGKCPACGIEWPDGRRDQLCAQCIIRSLPEEPAYERFARRVEETVSTLKNYLALATTFDSSTQTGCADDGEGRTLDDLYEKAQHVRRYLLAFACGAMEKERAARALRQLLYPYLNDLQTEAEIGSAMDKIRDEINERMKRQRLIGALRIAAYIVLAIAVVIVAVMYNI